MYLVDSDASNGFISYSFPNRQILTHSTLFLAKGGTSVRQTYAVLSLTLREHHALTKAPLINLSREVTARKKHAFSTGDENCRMICLAHSNVSLIDAYKSISSVNLNFCFGRTDLRPR